MTPPGRAIPLSQDFRRTAVVFFALIAGSCASDPPVAVPLRAPLFELPADIASIRIESEGHPTAPFAVLELRQGGGFSGFLVINEEGQVVWYFRTLGGPGGFTRMQNGNFVFLDSQRGLVEVTTQGVVVHELPQEAAPGRTMHHDVILSPKNTLLVIADDWQMWRDTLRNGAAIWEWDSEGTTIQKRWSSFDYLSPDQDRGSRSVNSDWLHPNALSIGPRGNIILSLHFLNQVISISPDFQRVEWRMGGVRATIPVDVQFSGQHTTAEIRPGHILLFDNGYERTVERFTRALEFEIEGNTARKAWEWRPARDNWAPVIGSARRLENGDTMLGFGLQPDSTLRSTGPIEAYEVTNAGKVVWHITVTANVRSMYRATPLFDF